MRKRSGFWRKCRVIFRHFRRLILFIVLVLICAIAWLGQIGLPDFVKQPLIERLRAQGIELEFSRLRLSLRRGLLATDVHLGGTAAAESPFLSIRQVQLRLDYAALLHRKLQVDGLVLTQGKLIWPLSSTNALVMDDIQSDLRFQTNDTWSLDNFKAGFEGVKLSLSGDIAHASALHDWSIFHGAATHGAGPRIRLRQFADVFHRIHFTGTPQLSLTVNGDARDSRSFKIHFLATAPSAETPWGRAEDIQLAVRLAAPSGRPARAGLSRGWWTNLEPYQVEWTVQLSDLKLARVSAQSVFSGGSWRAPVLTLTNLTAQVGGGYLNVQARLDVDTRRFSFTNSSCFDPNAIAGLLTKKTRLWLEQFAWAKPPALEGEGSLILPAWTDSQPDWSGKVQPTVQLAGSFGTGKVKFRGITVDSARGSFAYSNLIWRLSHLIVKRPEGSVTLDDVEDDRTKDFRWHVEGALAPSAIQPLLVANQAQNALKPFTFTEPLAVKADIWGRLNDADGLAAQGWAALTNFTVHGEAVSNVESFFYYTNRVLQFFQPRLAADKQRMKADGIAVDFNSWRIYFTNGVGVADPQAVARAIGPKTAAVMEPYHFETPCPGRVNGYAPLRGSEDADIWFEADGAPFDWLKLKTPRITGKIHWLGETLILTNVTAAFYGGDANGFAHFDFRSEEGADFDFTANISNADMHELAVDLSSSSNHVEGHLSGQLVMTSANSQDWHTWNGYGQADLRDGLIWDVPVFGILSPILNAITPGLGSSRATDATAQFGMTNGVIFSNDLKIRTTMMRLQYNGTVNLQGKVNANVTAQLLRDTWVVGPLLSTALWPVSKLFEYKVSGSLLQPQMAPVYIPKILLMPLHPIRSFEGMLMDTNSSASPPQ